MALLAGGLGSGGGGPGDPRLRDQGQHQTQVMSAEEAGREESEPTDHAQPCGLLGEEEISRGQHWPSEVTGPGEDSGGSPSGGAEGGSEAGSGGSGMHLGAGRLRTTGQRRAWYR